MEEIELEGLENHKEALITPLMTDEEFHALKIDIMDNGQLEPITTYRGKVVDGRNRCNVLRELQRTTVKAIAMKTNSTLEDVRALVKSKETRRKQTPTQLAIYALRMINNAAENGIKLTQENAAKQVGTNDTSIRHAKTIQTYAPHLLDQLYRGKKVKSLKVDDGYVTTSNLKVLATNIKAIVARDKNELPKVLPHELSESEIERVNYLLSILDNESTESLKYLNTRLWNKLQGNEDVS